jgi:hypothetical protein
MAEDRGGETRAAEPIRVAVRGVPAADAAADRSVAAALRAAFRCVKAIRCAKGVRSRGSAPEENRLPHAKACRFRCCVRAICDFCPLSARSEPSNVRPVCIPARETGVQIAQPARPNYEMARRCGQALKE